MADTSSSPTSSSSARIVHGRFEQPEEGVMTLSADIFPAATPSATYTVERFDYSAATARDQSHVGELYRGYFAYLGLVFDPSLDTDFVKPCEYYAYSEGEKEGDETNEEAKEAVNGAYFVVRRQEASASYIVGTLGVRGYAFPSEELLASFVDGVADEAVKAKLFLVASSANTTAVCELKRMILHPECQGKGLGKALLKVALDWAFAEANAGAEPAPHLRTGGGYAAAVLDTKRWLAAANHLYERYGGFVDCGNYNGNYRADRFLVSVK